LLKPPEKRRAQEQAFVEELLQRAPPVSKAHVVSSPTESPRAPTPAVRGEVGPSLHAAMTITATNARPRRERETTDSVVMREMS